jgi:hypothetical protein
MAKLKAAVDEADDKKAGQPNKNPTPVHLWSSAPRGLGAVQIQGYLVGSMQASGKTIQKAMDLLGASSEEVQASGAKEELDKYTTACAMVKSIMAASSKWVAEGMEGVQHEVENALEESKPASWQPAATRIEAASRQGPKSISYWQAGGQANRSLA